MKFSIVTCTYNREQYIRRCLESSINQCYSRNDYEIVIIDNNSTDSTSSICQDIISENKDVTIRYFVEKQQGLSSALNRAIDEAAGEFFIYIDDDETIDKDYLQKLATYLQQYPQAELAASAVNPVYETQKPKWLSHFTMRLITGYFNKGDKVIKLGAGDYPGTGHTIIKKALYFKFGKFNTQLGRKGGSLMGAEDKDMCLRLIENNVDCYYFPDIAVNHHIPANKLTSSFFQTLTYSIGKSERLRTQSISNSKYQKRLFSECIKWAASILLFFGYTLVLTPSKGWKLIQFRWNVSKGLLGL